MQPVPQSKHVEVRKNKEEELGKPMPQNFSVHVIIAHAAEDLGVAGSNEETAQSLTEGGVAASEEEDCEVQQRE